MIDAEDARCESCDRNDGAHDRLDDDCALPHRKPHTRVEVGRLCLGCLDRHREWLAEIAELYATLGDVVVAGSVTEEIGEHMHTKKAPASPSPLRLDAWALRAGQVNERYQVRNEDGSTTWVEAYLGNHLPNVPGVLAKWAQRAYDAQWVATPAPSDVSGATAALSAQAEVVASLHNLETYDAELRWLRRVLRSAHGIADPQPLGTCLGTAQGAPCTGKVMPDRYGGQPQCMTCRRRYGELDLVRLQITEEQTGERGA